MNIREVRIRSGAQAKEFVEIVRAVGFQKYDKTLHSKVERPEEYGIRLVSKAESTIKDFCQNDVKPAKPDRHRLKQRVSFRPTNVATGSNKTREHHHTRADDEDYERLAGCRRKEIAREYREELYGVVRYAA